MGSIPSSSTKLCTTLIDVVAENFMAPNKMLENVRVALSILLQFVKAVVKITSIKTKLLSVKPLIRLLFTA